MTQISQDKIDLLYKTLSLNNPNPKSELHFNSAYTLLIATILSAQSTDKSVNIATEALFKVANTPIKMVELGVNGVTPYIKSIGLYKSKARHIIDASKMLLDEFDSAVPGNITDLLKLPGVGQKTANVVLNVWFNKPVIPVDTHVFRVSKRLGLSNGSTPKIVENDLLKTVPKKYAKDAHHLLLLHGRYICTARSPKCNNCVICDICLFKQQLQNNLS